MTILIAGASRGLGLAITRTALEGGHSVVASQRTPAPGLATLAQKFRDRLTIVTFDLTDEPAIAREAARVRDAGVRLTHIVNNAGVLMGRGDSATAVHKDELTESLEIQAIGPAMVVKHFLPLLEPGSGVQILNVSSESGSMTGVNRPDYAYSIAKCALNMYTAMLRKELAPRSIDVAAIHPGWIRTDMGGEDAPGDPADAARQIVRLLAGDDAPPAESWFFNIDLKPLPL